MKLRTSHSKGTSTLHGEAFDSCICCFLAVSLMLVEQFGHAVMYGAAVPVVPDGHFYNTILDMRIGESMATLCVIASPRQPLNKRVCPCIVWPEGYNNVWV